MGAQEVSRVEAGSGPGSSPKNSGWEQRSWSSAGSQKHWPHLAGSLTTPPPTRLTPPRSVPPPLEPTSPSTWVVLQVLRVPGLLWTSSFSAEFSISICCCSLELPLLCHVAPHLCAELRGALALRGGSGAQTGSPNQGPGATHRQNSIPDLVPQSTGRVQCMHTFSGPGTCSHILSVISQNTRHRGPSDLHTLKVIHRGLAGTEPVAPSPSPHPLGRKPGGILPRRASTGMFSSVLSRDLSTPPRSPQLQSRGSTLAQVLRNLLKILILSVF